MTENHENIAEQAPQNEPADTSEAIKKRIAGLYDKSKKLPAGPGIYLMRNNRGVIIYIGKSRALKNRVSSYFMASAEHYGKTKKMVESVFDFEVYHTKTELEALVLENQFIKQHMPRYNIKLKDAKGYPYIKMTQGDYPSFSIEMKHSNDRAKYFGPFSSRTAAHMIIGSVSKALCLPVCGKKFPADIGKGRPCLNYHIKQCVAPCVEGNISKNDIGELYKGAAKFLSGEYNSLIKFLSEKMELAAEEMNFELAAKYRDSILKIQQASEKQHIVGSPSLNADVFGTYSDDLGSCIAVLYVRNGAVIDKDSFFFGADEILDSAAFITFLMRFYELREHIPNAVYHSLELPPEDRELISAWFESKGKNKNILIRPIKGEKHKLTEIADGNAKELILHKRATDERHSDQLASFASFLQLEVVPDRIEAYDISNSGDEYMTCGMIVLTDGKFDKKEYKTFNIRQEGQNDYGAMEEAVARRMNKLDEWLNPDLLLLDGGENHVRVIKRLLSANNINIPVFGMVKDEHHKTRTLTDGYNEISFLKRQDLYVFLYKIQEEVHRYTFSRMDNKRRKNVKKSVLEEIPGVGAAGSKILNAAFGGLRGVKAADLDDLILVRGISKKTARAVYDYFRGGEEE